MTTTLNLAHICPLTQSLGPGNRFVVWVQGCPFNCKGCVSPAWIPFKKAQIVEVGDLAEAITQREEITGITLSGGEPMMQAGRLAHLLRLVKAQRPELNVIIFSGFTMKQMVWDEAQGLLNQCDLLVDGNYIENLNDGHGLRGSSNQQIHFLTDKLLPFKDEILAPRSSVELHLLDDGVLMTGIPKSNFNW
jgi:anaerobic ribonucleoside-triphosphate reductase activating protein